MENLKHAQGKNAKALLIITRVLASLLAIFFGVAFIPKLIQEVADGFQGEFFQAGWEGIVMELTFFLFMFGFIFSWWKKCTGGAIIFIASIIQMGPFLIIDGNLGSLIFGIPLLVVGVLFLIVCKW